MAEKRPIVVLACCVLLLGASARGGEEDGWKPWPGRLPGEHSMNPDRRSFVWAGQIVDGATGSPVAGCRVQVYSEAGRVVVDGRSTAVGHGVSDQDGFVVMGVWRDPPPGHWVFRAEGYAPKTITARSQSPEWWTFETPGATVALSRGEDIRGKVVDPLGRPVADVRVSHYDGCRHAPALQRAVTDAEGRFVFPGAVVDTLWIEGGGVAGAYASLEEEPGGEKLIVAVPGVTVKGRVLDPKGRPLMGIWVRNWARGPGVRTGANGRFLLRGADAGCQLGLSTDWMPQKNGVTTMAYAVDVVRDPLPVTLKFDPEEGCIPREGSDEVVVGLGEDAEGAYVVLLHEESGIPATAMVVGGVARLWTSPGGHELRVGSAFGPIWWKPLAVDVKGAGRLVLPEPPPTKKRRPLMIRIAGLPSSETLEDHFIRATIQLATGESRWVGDPEEPVLAPVGVPLAVHLRGSSKHLGIFPIEPLPAAGEGVVTRTVRPDLSALHDEDSPAPGAERPARKVNGSSTVSLMLPASAAAKARLHGRPFESHPTGDRLWIRGVSPGLHRVVLVLGDGRRFQRAVVVGESEDIRLEAPLRR